jgi:hypothetical protein
VAEHFPSFWQEQTRNLEKIVFELRLFSENALLFQHAERLLEGNLIIPKSIFFKSKKIRTKVVEDALPLRNL